MKALAKLLFFLVLIVSSGCSQKSLYKELDVGDSARFTGKEGKIRIEYTLYESLSFRPGGRMKLLICTKKEGCKEVTLEISKCIYMGNVWYDDSLLNLSACNNPDKSKLELKLKPKFKFGLKPG
jgi:hypothetical protein